MEVCILIYNCFVILWSDSFEAEDATDVISMIFRSADWILASRYKVTKSHVSSAAVILASTHLSPASSLLSFYLRGVKHMHGSQIKGVDYDGANSVF
ncbi:unnamed protein product [Brassica napus]|uniref:(rape) hypothetical protein n=1 Tax=Brassica napus TaxID=3708 RepID=A0A816K3V0_BRANA|nr:unnamed protein product [Brassica napus]